MDSPNPPSSSGTRTRARVRSRNRPSVASLPPTRDMRQGAANDQAVRRRGWLESKTAAPAFTPSGTRPRRSGSFCPGRNSLDPAWPSSIQQYRLSLTTTRAEGVSTSRSNVLSLHPTPAATSHPQAVLLSRWDGQPSFPPAHDQAPNPHVLPNAPGYAAPSLPSAQVPSLSQQHPSHPPSWDQTREQGPLPTIPAFNSYPHHHSSQRPIGYEPPLVSHNTGYHRQFSGAPKPPLPPTGVHRSPGQARRTSLDRSIGDNERLL